MGELLLPGGKGRSRRSQKDKLTEILEMSVWDRGKGRRTVGRVMQGAGRRLPGQRAARFKYGRGGIEQQNRDLRPCRAIDGSHRL